MDTTCATSSCPFDLSGVNYLCYVNQTNPTIPGSLLTGIMFDSVGPGASSAWNTMATTPLSAGTSGGLTWGTTTWQFQGGIPPVTSPTSTYFTFGNAGSSIQFINLSPVVLPPG